MTHRTPTILLIEPEKEVRENLSSKLKAETGADVLIESRPEQALNTVQQQDIDLCILNAQFTVAYDSDYIQKMRDTEPTTVMVVAVPAEQRQILVQALAAGAHFHIFLPYDPKELSLVVARGLKHRELLVQASQSKPSPRESDGFHGIIGTSVNMRHLFDLIERIAAHSQGTVLIQGESGTGKELVARAIHDLSDRAEQRFMAINCAAIPDELLESELFGYAKGAFTGANQDKKGRIALADKGTLFLDEIGDMKPSLQAKILRVLQEEEFEPVGSEKPVGVDVRVIAATHMHLDQAVKEGRFRQDLFYRLSVVPVTVPPLRERPEDIPTLVNTFILMYNRGAKFGVQRFSQQALEALQAYPWPGNVRELENLVQRMCILHCEQTVHIGDLPPKYRGYRRSDAISSLSTGFNDLGSLDFYSHMSELEDRLILQAMTKSGGNKKLAAQILNMKRTTLLEKIKKKNLGPALESILKNPRQKSTSPRGQDMNT